MKNNLLNEINDIKYLLNYNRGLVLSEQASNSSNQMSAAEKRVRDAYILMIDGAKGFGTDPEKLKKGVDMLQTQDEFYRMNTLFKDGRTGYRSFDEMYREEFELASKLGNNMADSQHIDAKLKQLGVKTEFPSDPWKRYKLVSPKEIKDPLKDTAPAANSSNATNVAKSNKKGNYITYSACTGTYQYGCKAKAIGTVQGCLRKKYPNLAVDDKFGTNTLTALKNENHPTIFTDADISKICGNPTTTATYNNPTTTTTNNNTSVVDDNDYDYYDSKYQ